MKRLSILLPAAMLAGLALLPYMTGGVSHLRAAGDDQPKSDGPPPLVIDPSAPLLLEDPPDKLPGKKEELADNQACFVCHGNYEEEELALSHAREDFGCVECHGDSFAHRNDEDNITPPDVMYWPERIEEKCEECHDSHDASARDVLARWQKRCPEKTDFEKVVCTDCHGFHRLERRTVRWEKKTGKLILNDTPAESKKADPEP